MKTKGSLLVVDDDQDFLEIMRRILVKRGYDVLTASSGAEAMARLREGFCHAVILDISLPDANGTELLPGILELHPDIIAVMLTGHSSAQYAIESLNRGAFAYLEKPLDTDNLLSVISRGLEKQHLVLENRQLVEELEQRNRITNTLLGVSQAVSQSLDFQQIIKSALERVTRATGIEAGFVYLHENDCLVLQGHHGFAPSTARKMRKQVTNGVISRIFQGSKPVIMARPAAAEADLSFLESGGYRSFAGIPLAILGESIGVMGVATGAERSFTGKEVELLTGIAREIAIAVRNAQLYEEASSARALRELDKMRSEFLANVSHELRTPLAVIKGSANSLLQPDVIFDEQTRQDFLQSIDRDADTLSRLVDDLLMMSRLEADALEVIRKPQPISQVISMVKDRLESLTLHHHLHLNVPDELPPVLIDDGRIGQVLTNLVENAVKYSPENTNIVIEASVSGREAVVSVTDEGVGIPEELHHKIFDRFFQGNGHQTGHRRGAGLGLAICRGIIETHDGRIWVESRPNRGAKFSFSLPVG